MKKYIDCGGNIRVVLYEDDQGALTELNGTRTWWVKKNMIKFGLREYKEPVKITFWKNVWQRRDGSYFLGCDWFEEKSAKNDAQDTGVELIKYVKTVKFETEIEQ